MNTEILSVKNLEFNNRRSCGLWLIMVGAVLAAANLFGGRFILNPFIFLAGYYVSFYIANINRKVRSRLSDGKPSPFQIRMIYLSIAVLFLLMFLIAGPFIPQWNWRMIWLGVNLACGLHFFLFYFVHGRVLVLLGTVCTVLAVCGYMMPSGSEGGVLMADALVKISFGIWMLFFTKNIKRL